MRKRGCAVASRPCKVENLETEADADCRLEQESWYYVVCVDRPRYANRIMVTKGPLPPLSKIKRDKSYYRKKGGVGGNDGISGTRPVVGFGVL